MQVPSRDKWHAGQALMLKGDVVVVVLVVCLVVDLVGVLLVILM